MKYGVYRPDAVCRKCGFPFVQIYRSFHIGTHDVMENKDVKKCKVKGEHLHMECACGYECIVRPLDWCLPTPEPKTKKKGKKS